MKKYLVALCVAMFLFSSQAFGACTVEDFQREVAAISATGAELAKNPEKYAKLNADFEKLFGGEMQEFAKFTQSAAQDPSKRQELLDKGCDLYGRMNKYLNDNK